MTFNSNSPFLFVLTGIVIFFVLVQSLFFLIRSKKRALELGISKERLRKVALSSALFTILPALAILLGVITLSKKLGLALPWLRLSVIGALTYELPAAEAAAQAVGTSISESSVALSAREFTTVAWVMTLGIFPGLIYNPLICRGILSGVDRFKNRDKRWGEILMDALFLGMISAFLGMVFSEVTKGLTGWIPVFVMLASACVMGLCGLCVKKLRWKWMEDFALPLSMIAGMALAIPITSFVTALTA